MGNAPLASPPKPTEYRIVMPITTKRKVFGTFGTKLHILPLLEYDSQSGRAASDNPVDPSPFHGEASPETMDTAVQNHSLPPQLQGCSISSEEYNEKLQQLDERLAQWRGGCATVAILCISLCTVLGFIAAYLTPSFWSSSAIFDHPGYVCAMGVTMTSVFFFLIRFTRTESQRLPTRCARLVPSLERTRRACRH